MTRPLVTGLLALALVVGCKKGRESDFRILGEVPTDKAGFALATYQTTGARFTEGNKVEWVENGAVFERIRQDIAQAQRSVNIVLFIWRPGPPGDAIAQELAGAVGRGATCRVLVDPTGSTHFEDEVQPVLERAGCEVRIFRPLPADENLARNHRKLVVVDGRIGFTGGFGFQDCWLGDARNEKEWRDVAVRVRGPVVAQLQQAFAENWQEASGALLPASDFAAATDGPFEDGVSAAFITSTANPELTDAERIIQLLAAAAKEKLWVAQAYFTPNKPLVELFEHKARAGVDVRILAPGDKNDHASITKIQRRTYDALLPSGVKVYEWPVSMLHSKTILVDDRLTLIGSMNFDRLSYRFLEEGSLLVDDAGFAKRAKQSFLEDQRRSVDVAAKEQPARARR